MVLTSSNSFWHYHMRCIHIKKMCHLQMCFHFHNFITGLLYLAICILSIKTTISKRHQGGLHTRHGDDINKKKALLWLTTWTAKQKKIHLSQMTILKKRLYYYAYTRHFFFLRVLKPFDFFIDGGYRLSCAIVI